MKFKFTFCSNAIKCIIFISFVAALIYPLSNIYLIFPSFTEILIKNTENEAVRVAKHLSKYVNHENSLLSVTDYAQNLEKLTAEFNLEKLKVFSKSGEIVYSSNKVDIGKINKKSYFHNIVKKGKVYTKFVSKNTKSLEDRTLTRDVVETYVPILKEGRFIGAFEIYYDITKSNQALNSLISRLSTMVIIVAIGFLVAFIASFINLGRALEKREKVEKELRENRDNLEAIVKERTAEVEKSREEWERTFHAMGDIVTIQDDQMRIIKVNEAACRVLKANPEELIGKHCYEVFRGMSTACKGCPQTQTIQDLQTHNSEIEHPNLGLRFLVSASPIFDENNEFKGIIHIAKDITEKKKLETQLRQAQKMEAIGTLAGGIAHDFNNILTAIMGYTDLAIVGVDKNSQLEKDLLEVKKAGQRATDLVKQILAFSRQAEYELKPVRIGSIIKEALKLIRASIPSTIEIEQHIDYDTGIIRANPTQIHQVLMNLCTNASHAMLENGGTLQVSLKNIQVHNGEECINLPAGKYLRLMVQDSGHGIPKDMLERIFEPYYSTKEKGKGTGIGLAVAHGIIINHGGKIHVESEPNKGTTFYVYWPTLETEQIDEEKTLTDAPGGNEHILMVDDEKTIISVEKRFFETLGYTVEATTDPEEALELFQNEPDRFDLMITDMTMPKLTGDKLAQEVLKVRPDFPVILCTGFSEAMTAERAKEIGIKEFLLKPLSNMELAKKIRKTLD